MSISQWGGLRRQKRMPGARWTNERVCLHRWRQIWGKVSGCSPWAWAPRWPRWSMTLARHWRTGEHTTVHYWLVTRHCACQQNDYREQRCVIVLEHKMVYLLWKRTRTIYKCPPGRLTAPCRTRWPRRGCLCCQVTCSPCEEPNFTPSKDECEKMVAELCRTSQIISPLKAQTIAKIGYFSWFYNELSLLQVDTQKKS